MSGDRLKLAAKDAADLEVIAAALQDAIVPLSEMRHLAGEKRFVLVANRFCWEVAEAAPATARRDAGLRDPLLGNRRILSALVVDGATAVRSRGIDHRRRDGFLSLLTLRPQGRTAIELLFAGGGTLSIAVAGIAVFLTDIDQSWPVPVRPHHAGK